MFRFEEKSLRTGGIRRVGCHRRFFMKTQWEVTVNIANFIRMILLEFQQSQPGTGAVRALEIRIFQNRQWSVLWPDAPVLIRYRR